MSAPAPPKFELTERDSVRNMEMKIEEEKRAERRKVCLRWALLSVLCAVLAILIAIGFIAIERSN